MIHLQVTLETRSANLFVNCHLFENNPLSLFGKVFEEFICKNDKCQFLFCKKKNTVWLKKKIKIKLYLKKIPILSFPLSEIQSASAWLISVAVNNNLKHAFWKCIKMGFSVFANELLFSSALCLLMAFLGMTEYFTFVYHRGEGPLRDLCLGLVFDEKCNFFQEKPEDVN